MVRARLRGPGPCGLLTSPWGGISPEVQDGVGNGRGPVVKGLDDDGETYRGPVRLLEHQS